MKKKLLLIRHAKAESGNFNTKDFDRSLSEKGKTEALEMAQKLGQKNFLPDSVISSPALRALETAKLLRPAWAFAEENIILDSSIYEAAESQLLHTLNKIDNAFHSVAIFGHNPGLSLLATSLCNSNLSDMPTCGMVMIEFDVEDWRMIAARTGDLLWEDYPKQEGWV